MTGATDSCALNSLPKLPQPTIEGETVYVRDITDTWREATVRDVLSAQFTADWVAPHKGKDTECFAFYLTKHRGVSWQTNKPKSLS